MIRHIVFFSAKPGADLETIYHGLSLLTGIPDRRHIEIGRVLKIDRINEQSPDFVVYSEFDDEQQLEAYKAHPLYQQSIAIVRPLRDLRIAADFIAG
jgi:hypothetical protein